MFKCFNTIYLTYLYREIFCTSVDSTHCSMVVSLDYFLCKYYKHKGTFFTEYQTPAFNLTLSVLGVVSEFIKSQTRDKKGSSR